MPATVADIAAATREAQIETWSSGTIHTRYPNARDSLDAPAEGFFDVAADGNAAITARAATFGVERRRFTVKVADLVWLDPTTGVPIVALVDPEQALNGNFIVARIAVNLADETTSFEVFG